MSFSPVVEEQQGHHHLTTNRRSFVVGDAIPRKMNENHLLVEMKDLEKNRFGSRPHELVLRGVSPTLFGGSCIDPAQ